VDAAAYREKEEGYRGAGFREDGAGGVMIRYASSLEGISSNMLSGFFAGWRNPPTPDVHLKLLQGSDVVELAVDAEMDRVVGYATGLTDHILTLYISYLEVLPGYQRQGIGTELLRRIMKGCEGLYATSVHCDAPLQTFYSRLGMRPLGGMAILRPDRPERIDPAASIQ
jgi:GNAT superfamily N-acetyltransferase